MDYSYSHSLLETSEILSTAETLNTYVDKLKKTAVEEGYQIPESFINLPFDEQNIKKVIKIKENFVDGNLKYVVMMGIGGSSLGAKSVYDALHGHYDVLEPKRFPKLITVDTTDPAYINKLNSLLKETRSPEEILFCIISKSGKTLETLQNASYIVDEKCKDRTIVITAENTELAETAAAKNIETLTIPQTIAGRFSVFSSVGLLPLAAAGIDIVAMAEGAMKSRAKCINTDLRANPAALSASTLFTNQNKGFNNHTTFFFAPELGTLGAWYTQLQAESLDKEGKGIIPDTSIGTVDLHSKEQLYVGGPKKIFFTFVGIKNCVQDTATKSIPLITAKNLSAHKTMNTILESVKASFASLHIPFDEITLENISETTLGEFMQLKMIETAYLGKLMDINTFNQPGVESYKEEVRKRLSE